MKNIIGIFFRDDDNNEPSASNVAVVNALNETGQRKRRLIDEDPFTMPPDEVFTHPMGWCSWNSSMTAQ